MVGEVEDVVDKVSRGWDLEVGDGPVVDDEAALLAVELEEALHPAVLGKLLLLRQGTDHPLKNVIQRCCKQLNINCLMYALTFCLIRVSTLQLSRVWFLSIESQVRQLSSSN